MGSSSQNFLNSSRYFFQLSFDSSDLLSPESLHFGDANGEAVAVFVVVEDAIHGKQELVTLRPVPAFYHDEADLHSFVIEDDVLNVSNLFVQRPINIRHLRHERSR
jgi:hypothetical protein